MYKTSKYFTLLAFSALAGVSSLNAQESPRFLEGPGNSTQSFIPPTEPPPGGGTNNFNPDCPYYSLSVNMGGVFDNYNNYREEIFDRTKITDEQRQNYRNNLTPAYINMMFGFINDPVEKEKRINRHVEELIYGQHTGDKLFKEGAENYFEFWKNDIDPGLSCLLEIKNQIREDVLADYDVKSFDDLNAAHSIIMSRFFAKFPYGEQVRTSYFDADCNQLSEEGKSLGEACAGISLFTISPISLIWKEGTDIEDGARLTNFQLDLTKDGQTYVWKASEDAPLLVYDPEHKGEITSASQLFGEWAFGGKFFGIKNVSLGGGATSRTGRKWVNGYEALAQMDTDRNGKVSGAELRDIGLWFDYNRNGVSEKGEVKPIKSMGVSALYYKADYLDSKTRSIFSKVGYERIVNGKVVKGTSVDWYGGGDSNPLDLINKSNILKKAKAI